MELDRNGGILPETKKQLSRAKAADLITFPPTIDASNCGNCASMKRVGMGKGYGYCAHPEVDQPVGDIQCCNLWNRPGTFRAFKK